MSSPRAGLGFILVTLFLDILGFGLIIPILPNLVRQFVGGDPGEAAVYSGWLISAYAVMQFIFSPVIGSLSDRFGRRPVLLAANVGQGLDFVMMGLAPSLGWLFVGRLISGITGASFGTATAYIADVSPPEKRAQNFGLIGIAFGLGFIFGPLLGGVLGHFNLRLPFFVAAGLTLANAAWGLFVLPESLGHEHRRPFSWVQSSSFGTLKALGRYPLVLSLVGAVLLINIAQRGLESTWVLSSLHRYGWDELRSSISLAFVGLTAAIVQGGLVRRIIPVVGERHAFVGAVMVATLTFVGYAFAPTGWAMYCLIPIGAFGGIAGPAGQALMSKSVPPTEQGMLQGGLTSLTAITQIVGPPIGTHLFQFFISASAPVYLPGASFLAGALFLAAALAVILRAFAKHPPAEAGAMVGTSQ